MRLTVLLAAALCASTACAPHPPGAGCPTEVPGVEAAVCQSTHLRQLDRRLTDRYTALLPQLTQGEADAIREDQRQWLQERNDWCSSRANAPDGLQRCLADVYRDRINDLDRLEACRADASTRVISVCQLAGEWTVSTVKTGAGVQALQENDSLYLNKVLRGDRARLQFAAERCEISTIERTLRSTRRWFEERYAAPPRDLGWDDRPLARSIVLRPRCRSGALGPAAAGGSEILVGSGGEIGLTYYDGAFLILRPSR
jgi:uncharacterized protein YecT (DUF1311 family)